MSDEINQYIQTYKYVSIIYIDIAECTGCSLSHLAAWEVHKKILDKYNIGVLLVFRNTDEEQIVKILKSKKITFPFIFDKTGEFKTGNKIFKSIKDNIFVIDRDKNVISLESPIKNEQTWKNFMKIVNNYK
ncbi:MAG: redoxin domain-containing protein [Prevotellaceae bacterium]|nr:redoxin domain-containing protein [Prevotellaceae bacterium]